MRLKGLADDQRIQQLADCKLVPMPIGVQQQRSGKDRKDARTHRP